MNIYEESLKFHNELKGKLEVTSRVKITNEKDLSLAYTPGVAEPCREIHKDPSTAYLYTRKWNTVAVISDGTAVLGLGDIGPLASLPVMEGKSILFKEFADVDAFPIVLDTKEVNEIVDTIVRIAPTLGGINLEDISAPRCFEIEKKLKEKLNIPVFHDDQHGTAIIVLSGLINALKIVNKNIEDLKIVKNRNGRKPVGTFELDHFYSKDEFPMFAVSFYNLIPVCGTCNRIKSNTVFNINPYLMYDKKDNISFEYNILGSNYMENEDELEIRIKSSSKEALEDAQNLRLEEIYNRHKDIVQEIIKKMKYYNSEYIECLFKDTGALFQSKDELYRLLYGGYANPDEFGKRPLSKFIKDIYQNTKEVLDGFDIFSDIDT